MIFSSKYNIRKTLWQLLLLRCLDAYAYLRHVHSLHVKYYRGEQNKIHLRSVTV